MEILVWMFMASLLFLVVALGYNDEMNNLYVKVTSTIIDLSMLRNVGSNK